VLFRSGTIILDGAATSRPTFTPRITGNYLFRLKVTDASGQGAESMTAVYVTGPPLDLQVRLLTGGRLELIWSGAAVGYAIETRNELDSSSGWEPWTGAPPVQRAGQWVLTVTASDRAKFFRLRQ
jgi:hypothetical protein